MNKINRLRQVQLSLQGLTFYDDILEDQKVSDFCLLLKKITKAVMIKDEIYEFYFKFYKQVIGMNWPHYLVEYLLNSQKITAITITYDVKQHIENDLLVIQKLTRIKPSDLKEYTCLP